MLKSLKNINIKHWLKNDQFNEKAQFLSLKVCQAPKSPQSYPQLLWTTVEKSKR